MNDSVSVPTPYSPPTTLTLVDDTLSRVDARDRLIALLESQINSCKLQGLRSQIHQQCPDGAASDRIDVLEQARARLNQELLTVSDNVHPVHVKVTVDYYVGDAVGSASESRSELV